MCPSVSNAVSGSSPLPAAPWSQRAAYGLLLAVLCGGAVILGGAADPSSRAAGLRLWVLAGAGLFAVAPPNVLLPDRNAPMLQLLNWSPSRLLRYQLGRMAPLVVLVALPAGVLAFADVVDPGRALGAKGRALGQALLLIVGTAGDSFVHFATLGPRSQAWQERKAGQWYGRAVEETGQGVSLPRGLVPALFATTRCFLVALAAVILSAAGAQAGLGVATWGPGFILLGWAGIRLWRERTTYDRHFYHTTAFYDEVLGGGMLQTNGRDAIPYDALYWVPPRWRPSTWASLLQLDRLLPMGRLVALAHAGLWLLCVQEVSAVGTAGYLTVLFVAQTAACGLLTTRPTASLSFQHTVQSTAAWIGTRTFVNLRWLPAHMGSLALIIVFDEGYGIGWLLAWGAAHVVLSGVAAAVATLIHEGRRRRSAA